MRQVDPLNLRRRPDLEVHPQRCRDRRVWVIKDPVALKYFQLREEEYTILAWLDGKTDLETLKARFEQRFAPRRITQTRLHGFIGHLHRSGLVLSEASGQGEQLLLRGDRRRKSAVLAAVSNPLAIRLPGVNPERLLAWCYPKISWLFSPAFLILAACLAFAAAGLLLSQPDELVRRLPGWDTVLSPQGLLLLAIAMGLTKVIHELAHALTCKHFGGQVHELGVMFLVLTPCLYCNVSDAWKLPNRWHRIAITGAGIVVEMLLASVCAILWWYSGPGLFNTICFNVMVVCSVGTLLLNGNPLLRYDGYYMLSDWLEAPNLWQDSRSVLHRWTSRAILGSDPGTPITTQTPASILLSFGVLSAVYRIVVLCSILYFLFQVLEPLGLRAVAQAITLLTAIGLLSSPVKTIWQTMTNPMRRRQLKPVRIAASVSVAVTLIGGVCLIPLPTRIAAPVIIEPLDARRVYVSVPGTLRETIPVGTTVRQGEPLAKLENLDLRRELELIRGKVDEQQSRVQNLQSLRVRDPQLSAQLPAAEEILEDLRERLAQLQREEAELKLAAPADGEVLPPASHERIPGDTLPVWSGSPLDPINLGATLERRTLFCLIGEPGQVEAVVYLQQSDVPLVQADQVVRLAFDMSGGQVLSGVVRDVSRVSVETVPEELAIDQQVASRVSETGKLTPTETSYLAHVTLEPHDVPLLIGAKGRAKISVDWQPLGQRLYRMFSKNFRPVI